MIGLDTNVLVRYIAQDEAKQAARATELIESLSSDNPGFVCLVSVVELVWVMQACYAASKEEIVAILGKLLRIQAIQIENSEVVLGALGVYAKSTADFADCLIERSAHNANCVDTMTFDVKSAKSAGMKLITKR